MVYTGVMEVLLFRLRRVGLVAVIGAVFGILLPASSNGFSGRKEPPSPPTCFLSGDVINRTKPTEGFESLGNMIRLRFEAESAQECTSLFEGWCKKEVLGRKCQVGKLAGYFEKDKSRIDYTLSSDCEVQRTPPVRKNQ